MAKKPDPLSDLLAKSFSAPPKAVEAPVPATPIPSPPSAPVDEGAQKALNASQGVQTASGVGEVGIGGDRRPKAAPRAPKAHQETEATVPEFEGVKKTTVSFYATEQAQVDQILDLLLKSRRHRGGFSDAIKIALRLCPMSADQIGKAWDAARATDKRTQRGKA